MMMSDDELCEDYCYNVVNAIADSPTIAEKPAVTYCPNCGALVEVKP